MNKVCMDCGHFNENYNGGAFETCPKCGALYGEKPSTPVVNEMPLRVRDQPMSQQSVQNNPNMTTCGDCGATISKKANDCPHCGAHISRTKLASPVNLLSNAVLTGAAFPIVVLICAIGLGFDLSTSFIVGIGFVVVSSIIGLFRKT